MLKLSDSRNFSRTFTALSLLLAPVLFAVSSALSWTDTEDVAGYLAEIAASPDVYVLSSLLFLIGSVLLIGGMVGVIHLLRGRRVRVGQVGAALVIMGGVLLNFYVLSVIEAVGSGPRFDRAQVAALLTEAENSAWAAVIFVGFLAGVMLGNILLAIGLLTTRATPVWAPVALLVALVLGFISSSQLVGVLGFVLLAIAYGGIAWRMLRLSDEQWSQWQVLPGRHRRPQPAATPAEPAAPAAV